jgi:DivIVA domain-containing protein
MKVTPEQIRQYTFSKSFRGYDKDAVDQFLHSLSQEWKKENDELESLKLQLEKSDKELNRLKEVETVMFKAMKEADDNAAILIENANAKAANILGEAKMNADNYYETKKAEGDNYLAEAEAKAAELTANSLKEKAELLTEANETIEKLKAEAKADIEASEKEYNSLDIAKQQLLYDLKSLLGNTNDRLENVQTKYSPDVFNAKKVTVDQISKAKVDPIAKPATPAKPEKVVSKKVVKNTKIAPKVSGKVVEKKTKKAPIPVKLQVPHEPEDDGLPTVKKILALTEEAPVIPQDVQVPMLAPEVPVISLEQENESDAEPKSFFDSI